MTIDTKHTLDKQQMAVHEKTRALEALAAASELYERYVDIVEVANIAAFQREFPTKDVHTPPPLGLVVWPLK